LSLHILYKATVPRHEGVWGSGGIVSLISNFISRW